MAEKKRVGLNYKGKTIFVNAEKATGWKAFVGLMFSSGERAKALVFEFKHSEFWGMHSYFVFFDFVAVWTDSKGNVIEVKKVSPFKIYILPGKKFSKVVEIPFNNKYKKIIKKLTTPS